MTDIRLNFLFFFAHQFNTMHYFWNFRSSCGSLGFHLGSFAEYSYCCNFWTCFGSLLRGRSKFSGKGFRCIGGGVSSHFSLNISWKWNNLVSQTKLFHFHRIFKKGGGGQRGGLGRTPWSPSRSATEFNAMHYFWNFRSWRGFLGFQLGSFAEYSYCCKLQFFERVSVVY